MKMTKKISLTDDEHEYLKKELASNVRYLKPCNEFIHMVLDDPDRVRKSIKKCSCDYCKFIQEEHANYWKWSKNHFSLVKKLKPVLTAKELKHYKETMRAYYVKDIPRKLYNSMVKCNCLACKRFQQLKKKELWKWENAKTLLGKVRE